MAAYAGTHGQSACRSSIGTGFTVMTKDNMDDPNVKKFIYSRLTVTAPERPRALARPAHRRIPRRGGRRATRPAAGRLLAAAWPWLFLVLLLVIL